MGTDCPMVGPDAWLVAIEPRWHGNFLLLLGGADVIRARHRYRNPIAAGQKSRESSLLKALRAAEVVPNHRHVGASVLDNVTDVGNLRETGHSIQSMSPATMAEPLPVGQLAPA